MDIGVVLARASELHAKISDAIERAMRYEFLQTTSRAGLRRSPNTGVAVENGLSSPSSSAGFDSKEYDSDSYDRGGGGGGGGGGGLPAVAAASGAGDVNAEARSLSAIRDALEVLEEQLEALQAMQQQQQVDRDMALAELEESRGILRGMLKKHRGQEREVVREALAFAGEPVEQETEEEEDLPLPPYPMSIVIPNSSVASIDAQSPQFRSSPVCRLRASGAVKRLTLGGGQKLNDGENFHFWGADKEDDKEEEEEEERGSVQEESTNLCYKEEEGEEAKKPGRFLGLLPSNLSRFSGTVFGHAKKTALVVMSVLAFVVLSEMGQSREKRKVLAVQSVKKLDTLLSFPPKQAASFAQCPPGKKLIMEDGHPKCVVKERFELPFPREVKTPDVLHGRG